MNPNRAPARIAMLAAVLGNLLAVSSASAAHDEAGRRASRHFDLVNATFDSIIALAIAPADSDAFQDIALGQPLQGGLTSMTFDVPLGGCLRDLRITFPDRRARFFRRVDVCRSSGLRLTPRGSS